MISYSQLLCRATSCVLSTASILRRLQRTSLRALAVAGSLSGIVVSIAYLLVLGLVHNFPVAIDLMELVPGAILGVLTLSVFVLIAGVNNLREKRVAE